MKIRSKANVRTPTSEYVRRVMPLIMALQKLGIINDVSMHNVIIDDKERWTLMVEAECK